MEKQLLRRSSVLRWLKHLKGVRAAPGGSVGALVSQYLEQDAGAKIAANRPVSQRFFYTSKERSDRTDLSPLHKSIQLRLGDARLLASSENTRIGNLNEAHPLFYAETAPQRSGLCAALTHALHRLRILRLTELQGALIPLVLKGKHVIAHSETGTGKSFGIALAIVNRILRDQVNYRLHTLILVPTEELSLQYEKWIRHFGGASSQIVQVAVSSIPLEVQLGRLHNIQPHILVGTPQRVAEITELAPTLFNEKLRRKVDCLVLDEADVVLSETIRTQRGETDGAALVERLFRSRPEEVPAQLVAASATVDSATAQMLNKWTRNDKAIRLTTSFSEHSIPPSILFYFFSAKPGFPLPRCLSLMLELIVRGGAERRRTLRVLVVTSREEVETVSGLLNGDTMRSRLSDCLVSTPLAAPLHKHVGSDAVDESAPPSPVTSPARSVFQTSPRIYRRKGDVYVKDRTALSAFVEGRLLAGITTFESCRGIHVGGVTHVILYGECPNPNTFLHCAGRTGRMGEEGAVVVLFPPSSGRQVQRVCGAVEIPFHPGKIEEVDRLLEARVK